MSQVLEKRSADSRWFDLDCTALLLPDETISGTPSVAADQGNLTFGTPQVNGLPLIYPDGGTAPTGKVVQVLISGGSIPAGRKFLDCYVRALLVTNLNPEIEATVVLRLVDTPNLDATSTCC